MRAAIIEMARTRSKPNKAAPKASTPEEPPVSTAKPLPAGTSNPPKLFVLPKDASKDARIVTLDNPANATPSRYFFCPEKGFYEFTRIAAPKKDCRSWLITGEPSENQDEQPTEEKQDPARIGSGYINKTADLFIATPMDTLFLILPALAPKSTKDTKQHFLALEDYLDKLSSSCSHWKALLSQYPSLKPLVERRMRVLCDTVDAGDETMFRISMEKLSGVLLKKAERMVKRGLPPSMEDKLVKTALEVPVMNIKREEESTVSTTEQTFTETTTTTTTTTTPSHSAAYPTTSAGSAQSKKTTTR
ncbi:ribonuclease h2 subunit b [Pyrenophora seminiperda CCB06]|uniref:Ribonuclease H2 subunit B n=1 Tax=Pyrenophora seminiperda CCB06 TaxID=1302712 RepID=A0A3M7MAW5_9PLEO|nr:ribonuclease h2 subunit b [Pyrenophora seminiperda CCB06]